MSTGAFYISSLLEKMTSSDKDFRFMATSDLMSELQKDSIQLDEDSERKVVRTLLRLLEDRSGEVQNLAVKCLGPLVGKVKEYQVENIVDTLCANMRSDKEQLRDIAGIGLKTVLSELPPAATGAHLDRLVPMVEEFCNLDDDELRESCLQAFEAFLRKCPKEMDPHVPNVTSLCLQYMKHDPNYDHDSDDEEQMETEDSEFSEQESEDEYSDDDDMSWKVRRAAAKCMAALISSRPDLLPDFHCTLAPALIRRFKEREENVKADIFGAYIMLLRHTRPPKGWLEAVEEPTQTGRNLNMLRAQVPLVIKALQRQLKDRNVRTRQGCFNLFTELAGVLPGSLAEHMAVLVSGQPYTRSTVITAVKFLISDQPHSIDPLLKSFIAEFMESLQDPDLNVRRATLTFFNSAVHNKPSLVRDLLDDILPLLYQETKIRRDLIREVEMGPFKHTVDDGLDVRKAAFECMYSLLESCLGQLDMCEFLNHVEDGLKDHYDIRMLTFIMLARLATLCPAPVLQRVDRLIEPLRATCTAKVKAGSVKQELEKQEELKRSAMRAVAALLTNPEVRKSPTVADFSAQIRSNPELTTLFESIQKDTASGPSTDSMELS